MYDLAVCDSTYFEYSLAHAFIAFSSSKRPDFASSNIRNPDRVDPSDIAARLFVGLDDSVALGVIKYFAGRLGKLAIGWKELDDSGLCILIQIMERTLLLYRLENFTEIPETSGLNHIRTAWGYCGN